MGLGRLETPAPATGQAALVLTGESEAGGQLGGHGQKLGLSEVTVQCDLLCLHSGL